MNEAMKKVALATICAGGMIATMQAQAANWLMLQGTEPSSAAGRAKVWGWIQVDYQKDTSSECTDAACGPAADGYIPPKLIGPNLDSQEAFTVRRAAIGVRGTGMPIDSKVNYFLLAQGGNNLVTYANGGSARLTDASITLNHMTGARIRAGLFKTPGSEESAGAVFLNEYVNFTETTNQLLLERRPAASDRFDIPDPTPQASMNAYSTPVFAFRDVGIQIFGSFMGGGWDTSYAVMVGNGNGLNMSDNDDNKETYAYVSTEMVMGGKGPRREGLKLFAWRQNGKRTNSYDPTEEQERSRQGVGVKYLKKPFRATVEYIKGKGMIFQGQHRPGANPPGTVVNFNGTWNDLEAVGYYVDLGFYIPNSNWEIDARYEKYVRDENHNTSVDGDESSFITKTIGANYHINKKTRLTLNIADRDFESDTTAVDVNLAGVKKRYAAGLTHVF